MKTLVLPKALQRIDPPCRVAVLGIGNELRGDDGAGVLVARKLCRRGGGDPQGMVLEAGLAPENCTGAVRRFSPDRVILVDAAQWGGKAGEILWVDGHETTGWSGSTHTLPLAMLAAFLTSDLGCQVTIAGIQPECLEFGVPLSRPVEKAVNDLVELLARDLLRS